MHIKFVKAAIGDINAVAGLLSLLYKKPQDEITTETEQDITNKDMAFFLAFDGGAPVGVSQAALRREYVNGAGSGLKGYLEAIYVLPGYRRKGVATRLVKEAERWAGGLGCRKFASDCLLENTDSFKFHISLGFKETERNIFFLKELEPPTGYEIRPIDAGLREKVQPMHDLAWGSPFLAINGRLWDSRVLPGYAAVGENEVLGYLLYAFHDGVCEIMALESSVKNIGVASALIERVKQTAKSQGFSKIIVQTSNDNIRALRFYQRRGFTIRAVRLGALDAARALKPEIPLTGEGGIPLRDEIEFEINS